LEQQFNDNEKRYKIPNSQENTESEEEGDGEFEESREDYEGIIQAEEFHNASEQDHWFTTPTAARETRQTGAVFSWTRV